MVGWDSTCWTEAGRGGGGKTVAGSHCDFLVDVPTFLRIGKGWHVDRRANRLEICRRANLLKGWHVDRRAHLCFRGEKVGTSAGVGKRWARR